RMDQPRPPHRVGGPEAGAGPLPAEDQPPGARQQWRRQGQGQGQRGAGPMRRIPLVVAALLGAAAPAAAADKPNIVVSLSDDLGFSDLGCSGGELATPNLDALAANGLRFTQFYNTARCCPTRASLLTGLYPHQAGVGHMMDDRGKDGYRGDLNR